MKTIILTRAYKIRSNLKPKFILLAGYVILSSCSNTPSVMPIYKELRAEAANDPEPQKQAKNEAKKQKKQLRYLHATNVEMTAYFDDGTYTSCLHCDFCKSNIEALFKGKPDGTYKVLKDGRIQYSNSNIEEKPRPPKRKFEDGWMLIDYKWNTKVPQQ